MKTIWRSNTRGWPIRSARGKLRASSRIDSYKNFATVAYEGTRLAI